MISLLHRGDGLASQLWTGEQTYLSTIESQSQVLVQRFYSDKSAARGGWPASQLWTGKETYLSTIEFQSQILIQRFYSDKSAARGGWPGQPAADRCTGLLIHYRIFHCLADLFKFYSGAARRRTLGYLSLWNLLFGNSEHSIVAPPAG